MKDALHRFYFEPFKFMDNLNLMVKGNNLNIFQKVSRLRKSALGMAVICGFAWLIFGFDSTPLQFIHVLTDGVLAGNMGLHAIYNEYYGKEMHYSAFVIYGLCFYLLSRHYEKYKIINSKNVAYACGLTFLAIGTFEFFWIYGFSIFQGQSWVSTWRLPQLRILLQNTVFVVVGFLALLYLYLDSFSIVNDEIKGRFYRLNFNWLTVLLTCATLATSLLWVYYPGYVERFSVTLENGETWTNNCMFPQTLYTIDVNPDDNVNAGVWFWKENDLVHGLNTIVKILWTLTFLNMGLITKVNQDE